MAFEPPDFSSKRKFPWIVVLLLVALLIVLCVIAGVVAAAIQPSKSGASGAQVTTSGVGVTKNTGRPPSGPHQAKAGESLQWSDEIGNSGTVTLVSVAVKGADIVATIDIVCATGSCDFNGFDWEYRDRDGVAHDQSFNPDIKGQVNSGTLAAGQKVHGVVTFQRGADDTHGGQVQYRPGLDTIATFKVP